MDFTIYSVIQILMLRLSFTAPLKTFMLAESFWTNSYTRLPGAVPQPLFLLLIVFQKMEVIFHFQKKWGRLQFWNIWSYLPFQKLRISSIFKKFEVVQNFLKIEVVFDLKKNWGCLPFKKKDEVVFHFPKILLPRLPETAWNVMGPGVVWWWW